MTKCERCDNPACIHVTEMGEGTPRERHFCEEHAREEIGDDFVRLMGPLSFSRMKPETLARLVAVLEDAGLSAEDRTGFLSAESAVPAFIKLLKDEDRDLRYLGAAWLLQIGPDAKEAVAHLRDLLKDEDEHVRRVAKEALARIEGRPGA